MKRAARAGLSSAMVVNKSSKSRRAGAGSVQTERRSRSPRQRGAV
jgi:hypothetical protein